MKKGLVTPLNRKAPQKRVLRGCSALGRQKKRLLLAGSGSGFAGTHFEAFFAKYTAALFGSFF
jgi:hypothetical protein